MGAATGRNPIGTQRAPSYSTGPALERWRRLEADLPDTAHETLLDSMPISIYGGG